MWRSRHWVLLVIVFGLMACKKDFHGIPEVYVEFRAPLSDPRLMALSAPNGSVLIDQGVAGIIIYNSGFGYRAYDRCSTVDPEKRCAVILDPDGGGSIALDSCSGGKFDLRTGAAAKAPAKWPLKEYRVTITAGNILSVFN